MLLAKGDACLLYLEYIYQHYTGSMATPCPQEPRTVQPILRGTHVYVGSLWSLSQDWDRHVFKVLFITTSFVYVRFDFEKHHPKTLFLLKIELFGICINFALQHNFCHKQREDLKEKPKSFESRKTVTLTKRQGYS